MIKIWRCGLCAARSRVAGVDSAADLAATVSQATPETASRPKLDHFMINYDHIMII